MPATQTLSYYLDGPFIPPSANLDCLPEHIAGIVSHCAANPSILHTFGQLYSADNTPFLITNESGTDTTNARFIYTAILPDNSDYCAVTICDTHHPLNYYPRQYCINVYTSPA